MTLTAPPRGTAVRLIWPLAAMLATAIFGAARLLVNGRFYFADDSEIGAFGQWWKLGDSLLSGGIPVLNPRAWEAGNYFAEGQWGLLNPVTWLIALGARASENPAALMAIVKIAFFVAMCLGVYLLARSFGASAPWAALAGVLAPLGGFTVYMDAPSWATGLLNAALLPWVWWGLRRMVEGDRSIWAYVVSSYVLITFGYVFGVMVLVVVLLESLVRALVQRDRARALRVLVASVWGGLLTIVVYLPGVLTAPVTERAGLGISNTGFLNADLSDLFSAASPTATATIGSWWGPETAAPLVYAAWILPLFPLVLPMTRDAVRRCIPLLVVGAVALLAVIGPSQVGPIRWPVRFMPYLVIVAVVLFAVAASDGFPRRVARRGILWSFGLIVLSTGLAFASTPNEWKGIGLTAVVQSVFVLAAAWVAARGRPDWTPRARTILVSGGAILVSGLLLIPQLAVFPATPLPKFGAPESVSRMSRVLADVHGDAIVVGDLYAGGGITRSFDERLMGNLWYLSRASVSSLYTVLPYTTFSKDLCIDLKGSTCPRALSTLWSVDPTTERPVADLMGVSAIVAMKASYPTEPAAPAGWSVTSSGEFTWLLQRDAPLPAAGGVAWTGDGTRVSVLHQDDTSVTLRVDAVGSDPRVVLSRLDYPGYSIAGAVKASPVRGWLLTADLSHTRPGSTVVVSFRPPGFAIMVGALVLSAMLLVGWPLLRRRARRRERISEGSSGPSTAPGTHD
ncbi:MAG: YfhO family protein [Microbacterium sp.]|nr:YfhO family protein [Microbacterium sp.]